MDRVGIGRVSEGHTEVREGLSNYFLYLFLKLVGGYSMLFYSLYYMHIYIILCVNMNYLTYFQYIIKTKLIKPTL